MYLLARFFVRPCTRVVSGTNYECGRLYDKTKKKKHSEGRKREEKSELESGSDRRTVIITLLLRNRLRQKYFSSLFFNIDHAVCR